MLQQLLKLYAPSVLASLLVQSSELQSEKPAEQPQAFFLIADADTVWLQASDRSRGCTDKGHCLTAERACVFAFRFSLSFARTQLETRPVDMRLSCPFESFGRSSDT